jgi:hypothetical protein
MKPDKRKPSNLIFAVVHFCIAGLFACAFYDRFWRWRDELSQVETSFITPDGANVTSGGMFWILPVGVFAILGILRVARYLRYRQ